MPGFGGGRFGAGTFGGSNVTPIEVHVTEALTVAEAVLVEGVVAATETVEITEDLVVTKRESLTVSESLSMAEDVATGSLRLETVDGRRLDVTFPFELHYDGVLDPGKYQLVPDRSGSPGAPVSILGVTPVVEELQAGSSGGVFPTPVTSGVYDLSSAHSSYFRLAGEVDPTDNLGDFLVITAGQNEGLYQILEVVQSGPPEAIVLLDRPMTLLDGLSGVEGIQSAPVLG